MEHHDETGIPHGAASARAWAIAMTRRPSVTGSPGEASFGPWLAEQLSTCLDAPSAEVWTFGVPPDGQRHCVAMLVRGQGRETVLLTGHYDTVAVSDYGDLADIATEPEALAKALLRRLDRSASTPAELRAKADLASGVFLPGRGLLDMKAGLAAGIAVAARFARKGGRGNILFLAVPDEERSSDGARRAAPELRTIAREHDLEIIGAVNLDAVADDGDGAAGRSVALGTIGKLLPTAFVVGLPTHAGFPQAGLNAAVLAAAIVSRAEWAVELTDHLAGPATPPSLLMLSDGRSGYDVTTPATAYAAFNVNIVRRTPADVLDAFDELCREAVDGVLSTLRKRATRFRPGPTAIGSVHVVPVLRFSALAEHVRSHDAAGFDKAHEFADMPDSGLPARCRRLTERLWLASGWQGPAVVTGFGSVPYLPTHLSGSLAARRLEQASLEATRLVGLRHGATIRCDPVFAGISDMSFFGEADEGLLGDVLRNTPGWASWMGWPAAGDLAGIPIINAGPWGRDYHTPLERINVDYAFEVLPDLISDIVARLFDTGAEPSKPAGASP